MDIMIKGIFGRIAHEAIQVRDQFPRKKQYNLAGEKFGELVFRIVSLDPSAIMSLKLIDGATLKRYEGAPHEMPITHHNEINFWEVSVASWAAGCKPSETSKSGGAFAP